MAAAVAAMHIVHAEAPMMARVSGAAGDDQRRHNSRQTYYATTKP
jgi:hypothetical protein